MPEIPVAHWWRTFKKTPATIANNSDTKKAGTMPGLDYYIED
jgi:hypothetical protein